MSVPRPAVIAFDVLETLVPLDALEWRFREAGVPRVLMRRWSDHLLRDAFALAAAGGLRTFRDLALAALDDVTGHQVGRPAAEALVDAIAELEPRPDAGEALARARESGARVIALDNAPGPVVRALLERTGRASDVEAVISADASGRWKPSAGIYLHAADHCGTEPGRVALITAHGWDVHGARRAGLSAAWSAHAESRFPAAFEPPNASGPDPVRTVEALLTCTEGAPPPPGR
ncbi:HAD family hydrolase [Nocardiopsis composta]|uniref:2-haloacid dehalogenase n=1 Tax=Nocardiopsis composta TaxID=157465 RepID=A0A7W8QJT3_9ACTN|nr:HAD family hydrolase [Nocardiopsis composta]MBB5430806.1 2-haloacid dehalogenase [Nocardiopsis composta]